MSKPRGSIFQRKDGRWTGAIWDKVQQKRRCCYGKTREEAEAKLAQLTASLGPQARVRNRFIGLTGVDQARAELYAPFTRGELNTIKGWARSCVGYEGCVYLLHDGIKYKIGHTSKTGAERLRNLRTANPDLILIAEIPSSVPKKLEQRIHDALETQRIIREYFALLPWQVRWFQDTANDLTAALNEIPRAPIIVPDWYANL